MADLTTVARPYAKALFDLARRQGSLERWSQTLGTLAEIAGDEAMHALVQNPKVSDEEVINLINSVAGERFDDSARNLVRLLADNDRLPALPDIAALFEVMKAESEGAIDVDVFSPHPVSDSYKHSLSESLRRKLGRDVRMNFSIDESLIGGALIKAGDLVIDGTVRGRLNKLSGALAN